MAGRSSRRYSTTTRSETSCRATRCSPDGYHRPPPRRHRVHVDPNMDNLHCFKNCHGLGGQIILPETSKPAATDTTHHAGTPAPAAPTPTPGVVTPPAGTIPPPPPAPSPAPAPASSPHDTTPGGRPRPSRCPGGNAARRARTRDAPGRARRGWVGARASPERTVSPRLRGEHRQHAVPLDQGHGAARTRHTSAPV